MSKQNKSCEKLFAKGRSHKILVLEYVKYSQKSIIKSNQNDQNIWVDTGTKEDIQMTNKYMEKMISIINH